MTDEEKKKMADLEKKVADLTISEAQAIKDRDKASQDLAKSKTDITKLGADLKKKDEIITKKTQDIVGARRKFSERPKEEVEAMTDAEKEALQRQEETDEKLAKMEKDAQEGAQKQRDAAIAASIRKITNKPEIAAKIEANLKRLNGWDKLATPDEIEANIATAYDMLGSAKPAAIAQVLGGSGEAPGEGDKKSFADTPEGQDLMSKLGPITPPGVVAK